MSLIPDRAAFQRRLGGLPITTYQAGESVLTSGSRTGRCAVSVVKEEIERPLRPEKNCTRRRNELIAKGAMNTGEYGLEYPKLAEVRPLIVGWSSVHRCPIGCVMLQSLPTHAGWLHAVTQFLRECASAQSH